MIFIILSLLVFSNISFCQPSYDRVETRKEIREFKATFDKYHDVIQKRNKTITIPDDWGVLAGNWERIGNGPVLSPVYPDYHLLQNGGIMKKDDKWYLLLQAYNGKQHTRLAVSDDGYNWKHYSEAGNIIVPEKIWEGSYTLGNCAIKVNDEYRIYYFGKKKTEERIGLTVSTDMVHWHKSGENPVFTALDSQVDGTRVFPDCVIRFQDKYYLYYDIGWDYKHPEHSRSYKIGVAISDDGLDFRDSEQSPVLEASKEDEGIWDSWYVSHASVVQIGEWFYMMYTGASVKFGKDKRCQSFGLARAKHPEGPWEKYPLNPVFIPTGKADLNGDFDAVFLQHPHLVQVEDEWRLYYTGWGYHEDAQNKSGGYYSVGMAVVKDK